MENIETYRACIKKLLAELGQANLSDDGVESQIIMDTEHDHYQLVHIGWQNNRRVYGCVLHLDLKGDKIWIQHNGTEVEIAPTLVAMGVPKQHIVLGLHPPYKRQMTDYAIV